MLGQSHQTSRMGQDHISELRISVQAPQETSVRRITVSSPESQQLYQKRTPGEKTQ